MNEDKVMVILPSDFILLGVKGKTLGNKFLLSKVSMVRSAAGNNGYQSLIEMEEPDTVKTDRIKGVIEIHDLNCIFINYINGTPLASKVV